MNTAAMVRQLKNEGQDGEWYPSTETMILSVLRYIPENASSIMDIGAGDGRVLRLFAEKCKDAKLYAIEKSAILLNALPANVIPVGTEFWEQNLSCLKVGYIFCNPPYSEFEDWAVKIIEQGYANKAFLIMPDRWSKSLSIADAIKRRKAFARVIFHDDFLQGDRPARAVIDIVEISFSKADDYEYGSRMVEDPFNIWFDQNVGTFEKAEEFKESETNRNLARRNKNTSIDEMVAAYTAEYVLLESNYRAIFKMDYEILRELGVDKQKVRDGLKMKLSNLKIAYWQNLFDRLDAITSRLATASKEKLLKKLTGNMAIEFTVGNAYSIVIWAIKNANQYFDEQLIELFRELSTFEGVLNYKSNVKTWNKDRWRYGGSEKEYLNSHYMLDYRIVVSRYNAIDKEGRIDRYEYPGGLNKSCHELIADIKAVLSNLGFSTDSSNSRDRVWEGGKWQDWHLVGTADILFQTKAYMNGNLHFRFNQKAIMALNIKVGSLLKWVRTVEDVITEMNVPVEMAKKYINYDGRILPNNVRLLNAPVPIPVKDIPEVTIEELEVILAKRHPTKEKNG